MGLIPVGPFIVLSVQFFQFLFQVRKAPRNTRFRIPVFKCSEVRSYESMMEKAAPLRKRIDQLNEELAHRGLRFKPHCWLSDDWFSPDGIPGIAIPFYLAHSRLMKLERKQMLEVEVGHALDTAYRLHRRRRWREVFGTKPRAHNQRVSLTLTVFSAKVQKSDHSVMRSQNRTSALSLRAFGHQHRMQKLHGANWPKQR